MKKPVIFKALVALALQNNYMKNCVIAGIALISCVLLALPQVVIAQSYEEVVSSSMESPEYTVMGFGDISYVSRDGSDQDGFFIGRFTDQPIRRICRGKCHWQGFRIYLRG